MNGSDSPHSSAPNTPDESARSGSRPVEHVKIEGEDYFLSEGGRYNATDAKSAPITPQPVGGRNINWNPRIQFHDTWPSGEYDRRGDIATCNRLTPLLAQQIREEINNFKMVSLGELPCLQFSLLMMETGDGGPRKLQDLHALHLISVKMCLRGWPS